MKPGTLLLTNPDGGLTGRLVFLVVRPSFAELRKRPYDHERAISTHVVFSRDTANPFCCTRTLTYPVPASSDTPGTRSWYMHDLGDTYYETCTNAPPCSLRLAQTPGSLTITLRIDTQ